MGKKKGKNKQKQNLYPEWDSMTESTSSSNTDAAVAAGGNNNNDDDTPAVVQQASAETKVAPVEQSSAGMTQDQGPMMMSMLQQVSFELYTL